MQKNGGRGLYYADGLFETVRYDEACGGYLQLDAHRKRLERGAGVLGLRIARDVFSSFIPDVPRAAVRWTFWRRGGPPYYSPETDVEWTVEARPIVAEREPVRLRTASHCVCPSAFSRFKSLNALAYVLAARETAPDTALMPSTKKTSGAILAAAATGYNVFF
ncbi:MAG: aminotransferase class IV, partial [Bacteroidia bacterium]|nr:aminotransferase class IV [Bacteroidia bacterium]